MDKDFMRFVLTPIIVALLGVIGAATPFILNKWFGSGPPPERQPPDKEGTSPPRKPRSKRTKRSTLLLLAIATSALAMLVGYFVLSRMLNSPCSSFAPTKINITSPAADSSVPQLITVQGTACNIPEGKELWLLVVPDGVTGYYPQTGPIVISSDGNWSGSAYIGSDTRADNGRGFALMAALADQQGSAAIRAYFTRRGDYVGLEPLPQGAQVMAQVRVVRR